MPIAAPSLSDSQIQIGLFLGGVAGGLFIGWIVRGRQIKKLQLRSLQVPGAPTPRLSSTMPAKGVSRKSGSYNDLEWTDTSEGETDEAPGMTNARSRSKTKIPVRDCKMVLLVRMDLEMGKGKMAAQCAHAAVGAYEEATHRRDRFLRSWQKYGQTKIALKVPDERTLVALAEQARSAGLNAYVVRDAGRTQVASGSVTVAAIGPAPIEAVDKLTGHLKLL